MKQTKALYFWLFIDITGLQWKRVDEMKHVSCLRMTEHVLMQDDGIAFYCLKAWNQALQSFWALIS